MMNKILQNTAICSTLVIGAGVWLNIASDLNGRGALDFEPNIGSIKGSPYGKILGLAMQGPIDLYWHEGQTHEDSAILSAKDGEKHECAAGCEDHGHEHHNHHNHEDDHHHGNDLDAAVADESQIPWNISAKLKIKELSAYTRRRTNDQPLSPKHRKYLQSTIEDKLIFAYELDPTNFTNYGNYHFFLSMSDLGKSERDEHKALDLAKKTLELCKLEEYDPAPWATAAYAAYDIANHMYKNGSEFSQNEKVSAQQELESCINQYYIVLNNLLESGRYISEAKIQEMNESTNFLKRLSSDLNEFLNRGEVKN